MTGLIVRCGLFLVTLVTITFGGCHRAEPERRNEIRLGCFPNLTHAQALIGLANGTFQRHLGPDTPIVQKIFPSGPSAMEAILAGEVDLVYVGPGPAINGFVRSRARVFKIIAGAASGGSVLVAREGVRLELSEDYQHKRFASPQIGNTQDVSLRIYLKEMGYLPLEKGGTVEVLPVANPDILSLFLRREIHAAWVPEPWGTILVRQGNGHIVIDERDLWPDRRFATTVLVAANAFLARSPEQAAKLLAGHVEVTSWVQEHPAEASRLLNQEISRIMRKEMNGAILDEALQRVEVTWDPIASSIHTYFRRARELKYVKKGTIQGLVDVSLLNQVLAEKGLPLVVTEAETANEN
ncbi:MAG: ABC transporter substrate-binding protein [Acidobacteriota bacterium]